MLHQARRRSLDQEGRGGEVDAALPRRLRTDRQRGGVRRRAGRAGARLVAAALYQGGQDAVAVRRQSASQSASMKASLLLGAALLLSAPAFAQTSPNGVKAISPPGAPKPVGAWGLGSRAGDLLFMAGMQGFGPDGKLSPDP